MLEINKLKSRNHGITESQNPGVSESRSFLVRYRRTYILNNIGAPKMQNNYGYIHFSTILNSISEPILIELPRYFNTNIYLGQYSQYSTLQCNPYTMHPDRESR